ncbi:hypothetical protein SASPL_129729 [Salvia splendens]|uniref:Uncharacterized protein n=1 Tax=Salvia splendens TaxID=180675 RepID=A0A8X8XBU2_SALSN|nr:hypothetical protein SASPL_129729 [Salvia splendens]
MSFLHTLLGNMKLSNRTLIFGMQLWVVIGIVIGAVILLILFLLSLCVPTFRRRRSSGTKGKLRRSVRDPRPAVSKEIQGSKSHRNAAASGETGAAAFRRQLKLVKNGDKNIAQIPSQLCASAEKRGAREGAPEQPGGGVADFDASSAATPSPVPRSLWHSPVPDNCDALQR